ncbi:uncharacterized protein [Spinacia oleracea]|uniref:CASP-like protein n=1 Tax=Spinacia oleracea TaxID=3562 RepID=A0A9R0ICN1_SPIOL|nr:uncharacterized protein LOC110786049 [Spinacia oleracea]
MMDGKTIATSLVIGILGLISTAIDFAFEFLPLHTQARLFYFACVDESCMKYECKYFRSPGFYMVVAAIVCVTLALIIFSISAQCGCCRVPYSSSSTKSSTIVSFVICWLECLTAIILFLIAGAKQYGIRISKIGGNDTSQWMRGTGSCFKVKRLFGVAAGLTCISIGVGIRIYIIVVSETYKIRNQTTNDITERTTLSNNSLSRQVEA